MPLNLCRLLVFMTMLISMNGAALEHPDHSLMMTVVKVVAYSGKGRMSFGSGVVVSHNKVLTNCHVIKKAEKILIKKSGNNFLAVTEQIDPYLDVCLLHVRNMPLPSADLGLIETVRTGDPVYAYGYPNGRGLSYRQGVVKGLHNFRDSEIIEIDIGIKQGASGGGLFNQDGQLIGITTFYGNKKRGEFYAVPISWLEKLLQQPTQKISPFQGTTFWQQQLRLGK